MSLVLTIVEIALFIIPISILLGTIHTKWKDLVNPLSTKTDKELLCLYETKMEKTRNIL